MNPTSDVLEQRIALLEGGVGALAVASGQAAETLAIMNLAERGDNIVSATSLYGGTYNLFHYTLPKYGIDVQVSMRPTIPKSSSPTIDDNTKAVFLETVGNPRLNMPDLEAIAKLAHEQRRAGDRRQHRADAISAAALRLGRRHRRSTRPPSSSAATAPASAA